MAWTFQSELPIYSQLVDQIIQRIVTGEYAAGEKLPPVRELASQAGVNPNTLQRAFADLERDGLVFSQRTAGRFVTEDKEMIEKAKRTLAEEQVGAFLKVMGGLGYSLPEIVEILQQTRTREERRKEVMEDGGNSGVQATH